MYLKQNFWSLLIGLQCSSWRHGHQQVFVGIFKGIGSGMGVGNLPCVSWGKVGQTEPGKGVSNTKLDSTRKPTPTHTRTGYTVELVI